MRDSSRTLTPTGVEERRYIAARRQTKYFNSDNRRNGWVEGHGLILKLGDVAASNAESSSLRYRVIYFDSTFALGHNKS